MYRIFPRQDTLGGGFDATQAFVGELANFNIWDKKLSSSEIYSLATCSSRAPSGNVLSWSETNIDVFGGATKWTFEPCRQLNWALVWEEEEKKKEKKRNREKKNTIEAHPRLQFLVFILTLATKKKVL